MYSIDAVDWQHFLAAQLHMYAPEVNKHHPLKGYNAGCLSK